MKIVFICTGNTCRSPMAEALLKSKMPEAEVRSAGIFAGKNHQANDHAIEVLKQRQVTLDHCSESVSGKLLNWADIILTMTTQHKQSLILEYPDFQSKYFTLKEYVSEADKKVWEELKRAYANYEEDRSLFIQKNEHKLDNNLLDAAIMKHFQKDVIKIRQMEANLTSYDISDPFGGELRVYEETLDELDEYIELLIKKIKG